jgi:ribonuclease-3
MAVVGQAGAHLHLVMTTRGIDRLQHALGHSFANPDLRARALTHASAVNGREQQTYQRLEFLGDRVLGLIIADMLVERFPDASEGELSRIFHRLVSGETCAAVARELDLAKHVRMGKGPKKGTGHATASVLADVCEALIGAIYTDGGLPAARALVERYWEPRIAATEKAQRDPKTELQEWAHRKGLGTPVYRETLRSGPDHAPSFEIEVSVGNVEPGRGSGGSKREAEQEAAEFVLRREGVWTKE